MREIFFSHFVSSRALPSQLPLEFEMQVNLVDNINKSFNAGALCK
jgi:hypothetical protein